MENPVEEYLGLEHIAGVDEVGRGALAGPLVVACVMLPKVIDENLKKEINDSKKLSYKKRRYLYGRITQQSLFYTFSWIKSEDIDDIGIYNATMVAMKNVIKKVESQADLIIVDGNKLPEGITKKAESLVKADQKSLNVAAASILAKVLRDRYMMIIHFFYKSYGFYSHKGYPTKFHKDMIRRFGVLPIHRKSFNLA